MTANRTEVIAGLFLIAFSIFAWNEASNIRGAAAMFPRAVIAVLGLFSMIYLLRSVFNGRATDPVFKRASIFFVVLIASAIYMQLLVMIGYVTSTILFVPLISWIIGFRRPLYIGIVTVIYVASTYVLFELVFRRPMPDELAIQLIGRLF